MVEPTAEPALPQAKAAEGNVVPTEKPQDDKNRVIARLKNISAATQKALAEQKQGVETYVFNQSAERVIRLGNAYTQYLEVHMADSDMSLEIFQRIAFLAKNSLLMNIEPYGAAISARFPANKFIAEYMKQHTDLAALDQGGPTGPWNGIKEPLYFTAHNDIRERYREAIIRHAKDMITSGDFSPRDVDHLERFIVDPKGRMPSESIPEYVELRADEIQRWTPLSLDDFQEHVVTHLGNYQGDMSKNDYLRQLDEEIASIKPRNLQESKSLARVKYLDREKKLAFIRDLRFGRKNYEELKTEVAKRAGEITSRSDLRTLAPHLKQLYPQLLQLLKDTAGQDAQARKEILLPLVNGYGLADDDKQFVLDYLEEHIK